MSEQDDNPSGVPPVKRKQGRPRKYPVGTTESERARLRKAELAAAAMPLPIDADPSNPPEFTIEGGVVGVKARKNRWYFARQLARINAIRDQQFEKGEYGLRGYEACVKGIMAEAAMHGVSQESVIDNRSDEELKHAAVKMLAERGESIFEIVDPMIEAMERLFYDVETLTALSAEDERRKMYEEGALESAARQGKRLRPLLERLRALRGRVRRPVTAGRRPLGMVEREVEEAAHPLRFMAYVMRAGSLGTPTNSEDTTGSTDRSAVRKSREKPSGGSTGEDGSSKLSQRSLLDFKKHHALLAWTAWLTEHKKEFDPESRFAPCDYEGAISVIPVGHGKTTFCCGYLGAKFCLNHYLRVLLGHSQEDQACATLGYVSNFFRLDNAMGRRREALFPGMRLDQDSAHEFRIMTNDPNRQPSMRAYGMKAQVGGSDADIVVLDDPVDPKEREQPEERRRKQGLVETWMQRLRGVRAYHLTYTTLWHPDDANMTRIRQVEKGTSYVKVLLLACGGPEATPWKKPWETLWPEVWPASRLKQRWAADPSLYMAAFCSDPRPESGQIIRALRYYDPDADDNVAFMRAAMFHLSVDPAATAREHSDMSGLVYAACGEVVGEGKDGVLVSERRLRIIDASRLKATLHDLKDRLANYILSRRVDVVHVETQAAFVALPEMLRREYAIDCVPHNVGKKSKEVRLRAAGILIDDTRPTPDSCGAVVEFPGVRVHGGEVRPDPRLGWFYEQILKFGSTKQDDAVDALGQLVNYLARTGDLVAGAGWVTQRARAAVLQSEWERRLSGLYGDAARDRNRPVEQEDADFAAGVSA